MRIGERLEKGYGSRASEIAAELAVHFEEGKDYKRAVAVSATSGTECLATVCSF